MSKLVEEGQVAARAHPGAGARPDERSSIWSILSDPRVYGFLQRISGAEHVRETFARDVLRCQPGDRLLDIGCGTADVIDHLPPGVAYVGLDAHARYVEHARRRYAGRGTFLLGTVEELSSEDAGQHDIVLAGGVLHHLDDGAVDSLLATAHEVLAPGGRFISVDPVILPRQHPIARAMARYDRGRHVRTVESTRALVSDHFPGASLTVHSGLQRFPYDHVVVDAPR